MGTCEEEAPEVVVVFRICTVASLFLNLTHFRFRKKLGMVVETVMMHAALPPLPSSGSFKSIGSETRTASAEFKRERGKGEGPREGGGSQGGLGEGPGVVDLQRCWGCSEQSYKGRR